MPERYTLGAAERLKREKDLETLFRQGKAFSVFPVKFIWRLADPRAEDASVRVKAAFSAPKKKFRKATQRNRVKRLMRESWRLQKPLLHAAVPAEKQLHVFLIFTGRELPDYATVFSTVQQGMERLQRSLQPAKPDPAGPEASSAI